MTFYRRALPPSCTGFSSAEGRKLFTNALAEGYSSSYFPLAEQFTTQAEPAYCGISTLIVVLNALSIDPGRVWKGPWRWYSEEMLDCCVPLSTVQKEGITFEQLMCLGKCNGASVKSKFGSDVSLDEFRSIVKRITSNPDSAPLSFLICSYSRRTLGQTGDGHFSPIGAYNEESDKVLILDVARFKYPPHWVSLDLLHEAMQQIDKTTGKSRGFAVLTREESCPFFKSVSFHRNMSWDNISDSFTLSEESQQAATLDEVLDIVLNSCPSSCKVRNLFEVYVSYHCLRFILILFFVFVLFLIPAVGCCVLFI